MTKTSTKFPLSLVALGSRRADPVSASRREKMFVIASTERAKRVARDLRKELKDLGIDLEWSKALEIVARMYGYAGWSDLVRRTRGASESPDDHDCGTDEVNARRKTQEAVLVELGLSPEQAARVVDRIRPTARSRKKRNSDLPTDLRFWLQRAQDYADAESWERAEAVATQGLQLASGAYKEPFVNVLERIAAHSELARVNLGIAFLLGDAGRKDIARARKLLEEAEQHSSNPKVLVHAHNVLGDIAAGVHGTKPDMDCAVSHWMSAAELGSGEAAFNLGLIFERDGDLEEASLVYGRGAELGHPGAMTNLAAMILAAQAPGTPDRMEELYRKAASLGDRVAAKAVANMDLVRDSAKLAREATQTRYEGIEKLMRTGIGYDPELWFELLRDHGWQLDQTKPGAKGEGHRYAWRSPRTAAVFRS